MNPDTMTDEEKPITFNPNDEEVQWILGRPAFMCGPIAHIFQAAGYKIKTRCEDEQAFVLTWMLRTYLKHGNEWRVQGDLELAGLRKEIASAKAASSAPQG